MANKRMINGYVWEDEFFYALSIFDRLLWIGVLTADDQGRFMDNAALIRSKVFPMDDIPLSDIEAGIQKFEAEGKIVRYGTKKKKCVQIINWWKHQSPRWAGESTMPAPKGWTDRYRYHTSGDTQGGTIKALNWEKNGGFSENYTKNYTMPKDDINDDINDEVNDEVKTPAPSENEPKQPFALLLDTYCNLTTQKLPDNPQSWATELREWVEVGITSEDLRDAFEWYKEKGFNVGNHPGKLRNAANRARLKRSGEFIEKPKDEYIKPQYLYGDGKA